MSGPPRRRINLFRMKTLILQIYLLPLLSCASVSLYHQPRVIFTDKNISAKRLRLAGHGAPVKILTEAAPDTVTAFGPTHISLLNFGSPQQVPVERTVEWEECAKKEAQTQACNYNITVVHKCQEANQVIVCGSKREEISCCVMNISEDSTKCISSDKVKSINENMKGFIIKQGEPSAIVERPDGADLYITNSGIQESIGIHRIGKVGLRPTSQDNERHYVEVVVSKHGSDVLQDKIYAFYKEKNKDTNMYSTMWLPFVSQVCMADKGGPKNNMQSTWTSMMNARLFCGDKERRRHFSELVDVATVHDARWQDTRVYALFKNEWGMSAVCVYTIQDIDNIFKKSTFIDSNNQPDRSRKCVADSTKIVSETLKQIEATSEMKDWVQPVKSSLLISLHNYTHISVDNFLDKQGKNNHTILFLSLNDGGVHKIVQQRSSMDFPFVIAEYRPFTHRAHIVSMDLNTTTRMLYVTSRTEVVQLNVANCHQYGNTCEDCVLARDPYCGWDGESCTADGQLQDTEHGNHTICSKSQSKVSKYKAPRNAEGVHTDDGQKVSVPLQSRYFIECPVWSHHAQYTWHHKNGSDSCGFGEKPCLLLITSMKPEKVGTYTCVSEERGYSRVLAQYQVQLENSAGAYTLGNLLWLCLAAALLVQN